MFYPHSLSKVVDCNSIVFSYYCINNNNLPVLSIEDDALQLQYLLLTNFVDDYLINHYTLTIPVSEVGTGVKERIESFMAHFDEEKCTYIALVDLSDNSNDSSLTKIQLITNHSAQLDVEQLGTLWGNTVTQETSPFNELVDNYKKALNSVKYKLNEYLITNNLKQPKVLHKGRAYTYTDKKELMYCDWKNTYEYIDPKYGKVYVNEYINI